MFSIQRLDVPQKNLHCLRSSDYAVGYYYCYYYYGGDDYDDDGASGEMSKAVII